LSGIADSQLSRWEQYMLDLTPFDREAVRKRPRGWPLMHQTWDKLLFLHWSMKPEMLRPLIPSSLDIDTWEGMAWVGVTPFTLRGIRPPWLPALPLVSQSLELNVRTYVRQGRVPGIWFLSLDASNSLAVWASRVGFALPYFRAEMDLKMRSDSFEFRSRRIHADSAPGKFHAKWQLGARLPEAVPGTRDFFLIERYVLYSSSGGRLYRAWVHHRPWPLCMAHIEWLSSNVLESDGIGPPQEPPLVHAQAEPLSVWVWPPRRIQQAQSAMLINRFRRPNSWPIG
jgi:uncharacterized protein